MALRPPFHFQKWIDEHRDALRPPVMAKRVFEDAEFIVMVVGGPNDRTDYHIDPGEELFYQVEGHMTLKVVVDGVMQDITIGEGEMFLLPPNIPHSPQRYENTVGLVIERKRSDTEPDGVRWYCESCHGVVREAWFIAAHGGFLPQLNAAIQAWQADPGQRQCPSCGHVQSR
jgi:3-hydroxyanthranilate 3,4-dioxygenase